MKLRDEVKIKETGEIGRITEIRPTAAYWHLSIQLLGETESYPYDFSEVELVKSYEIPLEKPDEKGYYHF